MLLLLQTLLDFLHWFRLTFLKDVGYCYTAKHRLIFEHPLAYIFVQRFLHVLVETDALLTESVRCIV